MQTRIAAVASECINHWNTQGQGPILHDFILHLTYIEIEYWMSSHEILRFKV